MVLIVTLYCRDDGLSCYHAYDPAVALVKFHAGLSDLRCMLVDLLGVSDEQHFLLLSYPISELVNLLHRKKDQKIGTLKKEDNPVFLKACNEILELISLWNYSDQDRATFVKSMQLLMSITKFFGREEEPLSTMWSYAFCCSSDAGWHLRKKEHTDKLGTSTAKGSY